MRELVDCRNQLVRLVAASRPFWSMKGRAWLARHPRRAIRAVTRVAEALREVGVLLLAFTPLEAGISPDPVAEHLAFLLTFLGFGIALFSLGVAIEWRLDE